MASVRVSAVTVIVSTVHLLPYLLLNVIVQFIAVRVNDSHFFLSLLPEILHRKMCKDND
jgi:hypothetical protein